MPKSNMLHPRKRVLYKHGQMLYLISMLHAGNYSLLSYEEVQQFLEYENFFTHCYQLGIGRRTKSGWYVLVCEDGSEISYKFHRGQFYLRSSGTLVYSRVFEEGVMRAIFCEDGVHEIQVQIKEKRVGGYSLKRKIFSGDVDIRFE